MKRRRFLLVMTLVVIAAGVYATVHFVRIRERRKLAEATVRERDRRESAAVARALAAGKAELSQGNLAATYGSSFADGELHRVRVYKPHTYDHSGWGCWVWAHETESGCGLGGLSRALVAMGLGARTGRLSDQEWVRLAKTALGASTYPTDWQSVEPDCRKLELRAPRVERRPDGGLFVVFLERELDSFVTLTTKYYEATFSIAPTGEATSDKRLSCQTAEQ